MDASVFGAILYVAGEDSREKEDHWVFCGEFDTLLAADESKSIVADSMVDLERMVFERHPAPGGCVMVERLHGDDIKVKAPSYRHGRAVRASADRPIWKVFPWPLADGISLVTARNLCVEHKVILVNGKQLARLKVEAGGDLREAGFTVTTRGSLWKLRYNPLNGACQKWREDTALITRRFKPEFVADVLSKIGYCVDPDQWINTHPLHGALRAGFDVKSIHNILRLLGINLKLAPKLTPWRNVQRWNGTVHVPLLKEALALAMPNLWAVENDAAERMATWLSRSKREREKSAHVEQHVREVQRFCRWIRREAKVAKIAVPPRPVMPKKPTKKAAAKLLRSPS